MKKNIFKFVIIIILMIISYNYLKCYIKSSFEEYYEECAKCVDSQEKLNEAILKYKNNDTDLVNILEKDSRLSIKTLYEKGYLKELVSGVEKECDFRYDSNKSRLYCCKHGDLEFIKYYKSYQEKDDRDFFSFRLYMMIDIFILLFGILL